MGENSLMQHGWMKNPRDASTCTYPALQDSRDAQHDKFDTISKKNHLLRLWKSKLTHYHKEFLDSK
jgi:hypothetical protein